MQLFSFHFAVVCVNFCITIVFLSYRSSMLLLVFIIWHNYLVLKFLCVVYFFSSKFGCCPSKLTTRNTCPNWLTLLLLLLLFHLKNSSLYFFSNYLLVYVCIVHFAMVANILFYDCFATFEICQLLTFLKCLRAFPNLNIWRMDFLSCFNCFIYFLIILKLLQVLQNPLIKVFLCLFPFNFLLGFSSN